MLFNIYPSLVASLLFVATVVADFPTPDVDPFYQPPSGFASTAPGTVLKWRNSTSGQTGVTAQQILYRTTDANGLASATVATILKMANSSSNELVSFQYPEDSAAIKCSPSYSFSNGDGGPSFGLSLGYTLVVPDYEGYYSAFGVGRLAGHAVLDALRATLNFPGAGMQPNANLAIVGYSGGALATGWGAVLQKSYAPELNIKAVIIGGTPTNVTAVVQNVDASPFAGFAFMAAAGYIAAYPSVKTRTAQILTSFGTAALNVATSRCRDADLATFIGQDLESTLYTTLGSNLFYDPTIVAALIQNIMGLNGAAETPIAPVYMYHSATDEVIPYASANKTAHSWCGTGGNIQFVTDTSGSGHLGTEAAFNETILAWLSLRMSGNPPAAGCSFSTVSLYAFPGPLKR